MNQRFEEYVNSATSGVVGLSAKEREQEAQEIRQHLEELARKHEVAGYTTEQAISAAVQECGDPRKSSFWTAQNVPETTCKNRANLSFQR